MNNQNAKDTLSSNEIKNTLLQIMEKLLQSIQVNAIHVDLSDSEIELYEEMQIKLICEIKRVEDLANNNIHSSERAYETHKAACDRASEDLSNMYLQFDKIKQQYQESDAIRAQREAALNDYKQKHDRNIEILHNAEREYEEARRKAAEQNVLLEKWWWVPGYGVYLAIDKLLNDKEVDYEAARRNYDTSNENRERMRYNAMQAEEALRISKIELNNLNTQLDAKKTKILHLQSNLAISKNEIVKWGLILSEARVLHNKAKNASLSPEDIIAMQDDLLHLQ